MKKQIVSFESLGIGTEFTHNRARFVKISQFAAVDKNGDTINFESVKVNV